MHRIGSPARLFTALALALVALAVPNPLFGQTSQDINGDGRVDAVFTQKQRYNQVCFGNGTGAFTTCSDLIGAQFTISNQINTTASALIDWDGDGDLDIALAMEGHSNVVCYNDGGGQFNSGLGCAELYGFNTFPYNSQDVAAGDLNGDGVPDLVFANGGNAGNPLNQSNLVCLGGGGCYEFGTLAPSTGVALGDVDNDGDLDVVVSNSGTRNEVCLNSGGGTSFDCRAITQAANVLATKVSNAVAVGHLPAGFGQTPDANLDIAFANDGKNEYCLGNGNWSGLNVGFACGGFNPVTSYTFNDAAYHTVDVVIADFMPNPPPPSTTTAYRGAEIAFVNADGPNVRCFGLFQCGFAFQPNHIVNVNIGGTVFAVSEPIPEATTGVAIRDINIDGKLDVVVANDGISRSYMRADCCTSTNDVVANAQLHPSSVTLSGGTVGYTPDTTPPAFSGATNVTVEAVGASGATAQFTVTAVDVEDGARSVTCAPVSGSLFPLGNTTVTCTSSDTSNNVGTATFLVTIRDTTDPVITVPGNISIVATPGLATTAVTFAVSAVDLVDGTLTPQCIDMNNISGGRLVTSGAQFPGGTSTVVCGASDARLNYGEASFLVTVTTDIDADGLVDDVDQDDDGDGIADGVDHQRTAASNDYGLDAKNTGTVTRNGGTVTIAPTASGSAFQLRATLSGFGTAPAVISANCGGGPKELRFGTVGDTIDWRCAASGTSLTVSFDSGTPEFWKVVCPSGCSWVKMTSSAGNGVIAGSPVTALETNTAPILVTLYNDSMTPIGSFSLDPGESVDVEVVNGELQLELLNGGPDKKVVVTLFNQPVTLQEGNGPATFSMTQTVFASGTADVTTWDPIFPSTAYQNWPSQCSAAPSVGPNANWVNPHAAFSFPLNSHPWEHQGWVPSAFKFGANWINAWEDLNSRGPMGPDGRQNWTKYTTQVTGEGDFVVQFLADNCSWIYLDDQLIGVQDTNWATNGTGRYPLTLTGPGPHTLSFIILDGGGSAGGKFRLETRQSFIDGGGDLPEKAPTSTTVSFGTAPFTYTGAAFTATASVSSGGVANIAYSGDCINAGSSCTATATYDGDATHFGSSATASITIAPVQTTTTVSFDAASFVYTGSAIEAAANGGATIAYTGSCINVGTCTATATTAGDANHIGSSAVASADITKAPTTTTVSFSAPSFVYTGSAIEATASAGATIAYSGNCTNVGTCTATATTAGDANHSESSAVSTAEITKAATTTTVSFGAPSYVYTGSAIEATASAGASVVYSGDCTNVGTCTATATNPGDANHFSSSAVASADITKASTTTTVNFSAASYVYTGSAIEATASAGASIVYSGDCTNVGTCTATATNPGDANHFSSSANASADITKASTTTTMTFGSGPFVYNGSALTATASTGPIGTATIAYIGDCTNVGSTCTATATNAGDGNHTSSSASASITIAKRSTETTVSFGSGPFVYNGAAFAATASTNPAGTPTIAYTGDCTNAGSTCTATATNAGDGNHTSSSASASITIAKAVATVVAAPYDVEYDGQPHTATFTITGVNGETGATVGAVTQNTTHTNVGTYSDSWSFAGANYISVGATSITNRIKDTTAPVITSVSTNAPTLWPPNHKMVAVTVSALASDLVGVTSLKIISATSSEPDNGLGDGDTAGDIQVTGDLTLNLRAERGGKGNGRTYTITVEASDAVGNKSTKTCTVFVPKSQGK
ncbi:MAG: FG-GAP-like repeat-containing protein [Acidobacteriota bacterium]|nr:FG-GAP-like repeat-containing protein [Acidobacteriota bacterium]